ncbi:MAG: type IX secretion system membrane protein PorP/SprF [Bacteroidota bacterium]
MRKLFFVFLLLMLGMSELVTAQDPQFSQFYAAPLYLNPAFAGATQRTRVGMNYRNQWPALDANFVTSSAYVDHYVEEINSGVGALLMYDRLGLGGVRTWSLGLQYAYELYFTPNLAFRPGVQLGIYNNGIDGSGLLFRNQIGDDGSILPVPGENIGSGSTTFFDLSLGGVLYSGTSWLGVAVHHLTEPNQSVVTNDGDPLPRKLSIHGGHKIHFRPGTIGTGTLSRPQERSITPTFQYKAQGEFDQLDVGLYLTLEPIVLGTWYRGLPFKQFENFANNESLILLVGFTQKGIVNNDESLLNIGYSYDFTISELGSASGGAHEFTLSYVWSTRNPRKPPRDKMSIPCPNF